MSRDDARAKAAHAQHLLNDPFLQEAFDDIQRMIVDSMKRIQLGTVETNEYALEHIRMLQAQARQRRVLMNYIEHGKQLVEGESIDPMEPFKLNDPRFSKGNTTH